MKTPGAPIQARRFATLTIAAFVPALLLAACNGDPYNPSTSTPTGTGAPTITSQPTSQTVSAGTQVSFSVIANGTAPLTYQWIRNGTDAISGATSATYSFFASASDSGSTFSVTVTNSLGSVTSNQAQLVVN